MSKHKKFKEKAQVRYNSIEDILKGMYINYKCGFKEKVFDWKEIGIKNKHRIIKSCKRYGKVKRIPRGFIVKFN